MIEFLKSFAPTIAACLGGPLAGVAVQGLGSILGLTDATKTAIADAMSAGQMTPDQLTQIKALELQLQAEEKERGFRYAELEVLNTQGARDMFSSTRSMVPAVLTYLITAGFFGVLASLMVTEGKASEPLLVMLGSLGTAWAACVNFWFGSTSNSQAKTEIIARAEPVK